mmetsp:Transcript_1992/g.5915  ORF Transcript_1992/g.5915 Transcript_1992/m.5915 type:complete len:455 (-) Transcript_1992:1585-2949(-)
MLQTAPFPSSVRYDESSCGGKLCTLQVNGPCSDLDWQRLVSDWALPASALPAATSAVPPLEDLLAESDSPLQPLLTWKSVSQPPPCGPTSASSLPCSSAAAFLPLYQAYPFAGAESSLPGSSIAISAPMHGHTDLSPCFSTAVASSTPTAPIASWPHATFQPSAANTTVASPAEDPRPDSLQAPAAQSFCAVVCPDDTPTSARMASPPLSIHGPLLPVPQPASSVALAVEAAHAAAAPVGPSSPAVTSMTSVQDCALRLTAMQDTVLQHGGTASLAAASGEVRQRRSSFRAAASKAEVVAPPPPPGVLQGRAGSLTKSGCKRGRPRLYDTVTPVLDAASKRAADVPPSDVPGPKRRGAKPKYVCATKEEAVARRRDRNRATALATYYRRKARAAELTAELPALRAERAALQTLLDIAHHSPHCARWMKPLLEDGCAAADVLRTLLPETEGSLNL